MNTLTDAQVVVSTDVIALLERLRSAGPSAADDSSGVEERTALTELAEHGFVVSDRETERVALDRFFHDVREDGNQVGLTILTTLQCNFACDYCYQGDHGGNSTLAQKMSLDTASRVVSWVARRLDEVRPESFVMTFFGGEPLLNLPVMYYLAESLWRKCEARDILMNIGIITNGLLLTPELVERLLPFGLNGIKVTLDGSREAHDRMRPLRGGQGTFDRIIANIRAVADRCPIAIGGNFDASTVDTCPALLTFLSAQDFAKSVVKVDFKPIIREAPAATPSGALPLTAVGSDGKPLGGACMTSAGAGGSVCDSCHFVDEKMAFLREETKRHGFPTPDGVHMGPCDLHRQHAYTIGPDGSLYACPGFAGEPSQSTDHIDRRREPQRAEAAARFDALAAWRGCGDCAYIPVCAGGCAVSSHIELGDLNAASCHKRSLEAGLVSLAREKTSAA